MTTPPHKPRISVAQSAVLKRAGQGDIACQIIDVSADGFRIRSHEAIRCGEAVLHYNATNHPVDVRWAAMGEAGGLFV